jgi:aminoglycoside phosphotransferase (APT) family kinase protein
MSSPTRPSPSPPEWRTLLDPKRAQAVLREVLAGAGIAQKPRDVRVERCWPANQTGLRFQWSCRLDSARRRSIYAVPAERDDHRQNRTASPAQLSRLGIEGLRTYLPDFDLVVHTPDLDPEMPHVAGCLDASVVGAHLRNGDPGSVPERELSCSLIGYKPGRRAAMRYDEGDSPAAFRLMGKTHRGEQAQRLLELHRQVEAQLRSLSDGRIAVPAAVSYVPELRLALFAWAPGSSVASGTALQDARLDTTVDVLAVLHRVTLAELPIFDVPDELAATGRWVDMLPRAASDRVDRLQSAYDRLRIASEHITSGPQRTIHRDFYEKQLVWNVRKTTLLDLDTLARGDACLDLGNLISHLYLHRLQRAGNLAGFSAQVERLLLRYEHSNGPVDRRTVAFYCASSLIRGCALHSLRTATQGFAESMYGLATGILRGGELRLPGPAGGATHSSVEIDALLEG